jgi:hypothetical protein
MNNRKHDVEPDERELLEEFGTSFEAVRAGHAGCPKPEILLAANAGVLDEQTARHVAAHLGQCGFCRMLLADLTDAELLAARPDEERRVRERVLKAAGPSAKARAAGVGLLALWLRQALPVAALAGVVLVAVIWVRLHRPVAPVSNPVTVTVQKTPPAAPSFLQWEKLPVKLEATSILVWRGAPRTDQERYASELTAGLASYRDDRYAEAARQLAKVAESFPRGVEAQLYLGISRLYLQQNAEALPALAAARQLGTGEFRDDATWYLAVAHQRLGQGSAALTELRNLCGGRGNYARRACDGMKQVSGR